MKSSNKDRKAEEDPQGLPPCTVASKLPADFPAGKLSDAGFWRIFRQTIDREPAPQ